MTNSRQGRKCEMKEIRLENCLQTDVLIEKPVWACLEDILSCLRIPDVAIYDTFTCDGFIVCSLTGLVYHSPFIPCDLFSNIVNNIYRDYHIQFCSDGGRSSAVLNPVVVTITTLCSSGCSIYHWPINRHVYSDLHYHARLKDALFSNYQISGNILYV